MTFSGTAAPAMAQAPRGRSLRANFIWFLAGTVTYALCQWLILVILAKAGSREIVGLFSYALAATAPPMLLSNMQLRTVQAGDATGAFSFEDYFGVRLVMTAAAMAFILLVAVATGPTGSAVVVIAVGAAKSFESMSDVVFGGLQRHERMEIVSRSFIAKGLTSVTALYVGVRLTGSLAIGTAIMALVWAGVLVCYDLPKLRQVLREHGSDERVRVRLSRARALVMDALPLGVVMLLVSLSSSVPRYIIEHNMGLAELGVFSAVNYLLAAGLTVLSALGHSVTPRLARTFANAQWRAYWRLLLLLVGFSLLLGFCGVAVAASAGRVLLQRIYRPEYGEAHGLLVWTMGVACVAYVASALSYAVTAGRSFKGQPVACAAMLATTALGCWLLVPTYRLVGATIAIGLGYVIQLIAWGILLLRAIARRRGEHVPSAPVGATGLAHARGGAATMESMP
jgi:O-antigen/teichoic acid export membrane protein